MIHGCVDLPALDPDMLEIGNQGLWGAKENLTIQERRSHMALWCIFAAPLILGGDVRTLSAGDLAIVSNPHLIRINQDRMGTQDQRLRNHGVPHPSRTLLLQKVHARCRSNSS